MSKQLERKFLKPTQISKHLYCSICTDVFLEPFRLFCGHTYCSKCITSWSQGSKTCPICRTTIDSGLMGKDLIAEKIIQDLEVYCIYKLCDWKDRLENLPKHTKSCAYAKTPGWLNQVQSIINVEDQPAPCDQYMQADDQFIERVNELVPRKSLLERLYTKSEESQKLVQSVFSNQKKPEKKGKKEKKKQSAARAKSFADYDDFMCVLGESDEETKGDLNESVTLEVTPRESPKSDPVPDINGSDLLKGDITHFSSSKASLEKEEDLNSSSRIIGESVETVVNVEDQEMDYSTPNRKKGRGRRRASKKVEDEPNLLKKAKTTIV